MQFRTPLLIVRIAEERLLSGPALLELMGAVLARGAHFRFSALGWSMAPFIRDGDVITVSPLGKELPGVGEVVAFVRPGAGSVAVHRVVARCGTALLIKGDGVTEYTDGIIPAENLLGRVTRVEREGRDVWSGLGPERTVIAWLSRAGLVIPLRARLAACRKRIRGR